MNKARNRSSVQSDCDISRKEKIEERVNEKKLSDFKSKARDTANEINRLSSKYFFMISDVILDKKLSPNDKLAKTESLIQNFHNQNYEISL